MSLLQLAALALCLCGGAAEAQITANFSGGNGTTTSNQYSGTAGGGWTNAWQETDTGIITATVTSADPFASTGGNYLSVSVADPAASGFDIIHRNYSSANGVTLTAAHTLSFDFRLDSPVSEMTGSDAIVFFNSASNVVLGGANGFEIRGFYSNDEFQWTWRNGGSRVDSGMSIVSGTEYHFTFNLAPETKSYSVSISNGTTTVSSGVVSYRTTGTAPVSLPLLAFGVVDGDTVSPDTITYSLNNVVIAVPEPSVGVLMGLAALILIILKQMGRTKVGSKP